MNKNNNKNIYNKKVHIIKNSNKIVKDFINMENKFNNNKNIIKQKIIIKK